MTCEEGWDREDGREAQEGGVMGIHVCIWLTHFVVQQKLTQHVKQLYSNKNVLKKKENNLVLDLLKRVRLEIYF